jgi:hypothetical protein
LVIARPRLPSVPLGDYSSARWATLRRDVTEFVIGPWSARAEALGWSGLDLFGVRRPPRSPIRGVSKKE